MISRVVVLAIACTGIAGCGTEVGARQFLAKCLKAVSENPQRAVDCARDEPTLAFLEKHHQRFRGPLAIRLGDFEMGGPYDYFITGIDPASDQFHFHVVHERGGDYWVAGGEAVSSGTH